MLAKDRLTQPLAARWREGGAAALPEKHALEKSVIESAICGSSINLALDGTRAPR